ncbi:NADP-dependent oxidoreductase domain-containing protein [Phycomyces blakesleeanus]|uniref:NADP-dependent oxidoreductase domain-containing protein n=1 Tax=Phycomyces blakesleeanus TaxID=4837 RepID=A0ABR3AU62_PHYBL
MAVYKVKLDQGVVPTKDTLIQLGDSINVYPIAIGTWQWGDKHVWGWTPEAEKDAKEAFDAAHKLGVPFYDTAEVYGDGESEKELSRFRKVYSAEEQEKQIIATKFFPHQHRTQFPAVLFSALKDSLDRIGIHKVDLYQIHAPIHPAAIEVVADALADAFDAGLVKSVGVSNYGLGEIERMHAALKKRGIQLASNQVSFSLVRTIPEKDGLIKLCHDLGVGILAYSPIGMGILSGKYRVNDPAPVGREKVFDSLEKGQLQNLLDSLKRLAEKYDRPQSAIALNWCIAKGTIPLGGARNASQVEQNVLALGFILSPEDVAELDRFSFKGVNNDSWKHG